MTQREVGLLRQREIGGANFADRGLTYGSLGTAVGLLFYLASVVLLGAEINAAVYRLC